MLRPSYSELMECINTNELNESKITSRYTIVLAAAKRARQIIDGAHPLTYAPTDRAVSIAVKEMAEGKLLLKVQEDVLDGTYQKMLEEQYRARSVSSLSKDDLREDLKDNYAPDTYVLEEDDEGRDDLFTRFTVENDGDDDDTLALAVSNDDFDLYEDEDYEEA